VDAEPVAADAAPAEAAIDRAFIEQFRELDPDGGMALAARILGVYAESSGATFAEIERAATAGDAEGLRRAAHSLKSSAGNVGARRLAALLKDMESLGKDGRTDDARAGLSALRAEYARTLDTIHALIEELGR
jgi:HPt (histidine-containing phosphotransfer) domain-containing protein